MQDQLLAKYKKQLTSLNRGRSFQEMAPYKPLLVVSVIQLIGNGTIAENNIWPEDIPALILAYKDNWERYHRTEFKNNLWMPFNHMNAKEPFWNAVPRPGEQPVFGSFSDIAKKLDHVELDPSLVHLLRNKVLNGLLMEAVLEAYFPDTKDEGRTKELPYYLDEPEWIVNEPDIVWERPIRTKSLGRRERMVSLRDAAFISDVKRAYGNRCAISGLSVQSPAGSSFLLEACHIKQFSLSETEKVTNGIALVSTLHDAFDAGLITIDKHYKVVVSNRFKETKSPYAVHQFAGQKILLPSSESRYPSLESLEWHWEERFDKFK